LVTGEVANTQARGKRKKQLKKIENSGGTPKHGGMKTDGPQKYKKTVRGNVGKKKRGVQATRKPKDNVRLWGGGDGSGNFGRVRKTGMSRALQQGGRGKRERKKGWARRGDRGGPQLERQPQGKEKTSKKGKPPRGNEKGKSCKATLCSGGVARPQRKG